MVVAPKAKTAQPHRDISWKIGRRLADAVRSPDPRLYMRVRQPPSKPSTSSRHSTDDVQRTRDKELKRIQPGYHRENRNGRQPTRACTARRQLPSRSSSTHCKKNSNCCIFKSSPMTQHQWRIGTVGNRPVLVPHVGSYRHDPLAQLRMQSVNTSALRKFFIVTNIIDAKQLLKQQLWFDITC
jgi:hypothetical protein